MSARSLHPIGEQRHMSLRTAFTELFGVAHPIALAPMGGSAGGALAAAVANGGGLGLVGGGRGDPEWLERELVPERPEPHGVGLPHLSGQSNCSTSD